MSKHDRIDSFILIKQIVSNEFRRKRKRSSQIIFQLAVLTSDVFSPF